MERLSPRYPMYTERDPEQRKWVVRTGRDNGRGLKTRRLGLGMFFFFFFFLYFTNLLHTAYSCHHHFNTQRRQQLDSGYYYL